MDTNNELKTVFNLDGFLGSLGIPLFLPIYWWITNFTSVNYSTRKIVKLFVYFC